MGIGFSTGVFGKSMEINRRLAILAEAGITHIELGTSASHPNYRFEEKINKELLQNFAYVSLHAPRIIYRDNDETHIAIKIINNIHAIRPLDLVVIHPNNVEDFSMLKHIIADIGIENMDNGKKTFRKAEEIKQLLETQKNLRAVIDINHIFTNDKSMESLGVFKKLIGHKVREVHLSGFETFHDPLHKTKQDFLINAAISFDAPIILEGGYLSPEELIKEYSYVSAFINQNTD